MLKSNEFTIVPLDAWPSLALGKRQGYFRPFGALSIYELYMDKSFHVGGIWFIKLCMIRITNQPFVKLIPNYIPWLFSLYIIPSDPSVFSVLLQLKFIYTNVIFASLIAVCCIFLRVSLEWLNAMLFNKHRSFSWKQVILMILEM